METHIGMRRRGIGLGILSAEGAIAWSQPVEAMAVALTAMSGALLAALIVMMAVIPGNNQTCERVFRLLRWAANRPEPSATGQANGLGSGQLEAALAHLRRLTTDNARLLEELEAARAVSHLGTARAARKGN
jgi:hypothetical protein